MNFVYRLKICFSLKSFVVVRFMMNNLIFAGFILFEQFYIVKLFLYSFILFVKTNRGRICWFICYLKLTFVLIYCCAGNSNFHTYFIGFSH